MLIEPTDAMDLINIFKTGFCGFHFVIPHKHAQWKAKNWAIVLGIVFIWYSINKTPLLTNVFTQADKKSQPSPPVL